MSQQALNLIDSIKQGWWLVLVAAIAGAGVAAGISLAAPTQYDANATIKIDTPTVLKEARLPNPDSMVARAEDPTFVEELPGKGAGFELKAYAVGTPQTKIVVRIRSANEADAATAAKQAAALLIDRYKEASTALIDGAKADVEANDAALQKLKGTDDASAYYRWSVEKAAIEERTTLQYLTGAYTYDGNVETAPSSRTVPAGTAAIGGGLAGLALGLVLAWLRGRKGSVA